MNEFLKGITKIDLGDMKLETDKELIVGAVGIVAAGLYFGYKLISKKLKEN